MCFRCDTDDESYDPLIGACRSCFDYGERKMAKPHVHAALIKAWADGAEIEVFLNRKNPQWTTCPRPVWTDTYQYRIKPVPHKWQKEMDAFKAGKTIEWRWRAEDVEYTWQRACVPDFEHSRVEFRIKPPEPVVVCWSFDERMHCRAEEKDGNLKLTFEDGVLVAAEVLK